MRRWLIERYGDVATRPWLGEHGGRPLLLDAGCGAGMSALELFGDALPRVRYLGVDVSEAVDVAAARFAERGLAAARSCRPTSPTCRSPTASVDVIFSEGVLHHTDSTRERAASPGAAAQARRAVPLLRLPQEGPGARVHRRL